MPVTLLAPRSMLPLSSGASREAQVFEIEGIDPAVPPAGTICLDCEAEAGWWLHLRRCALCGHIGCCDNSPARHASAHFTATGHPIMQSFEPDESWFWDYRKRLFFHGPRLAEPRSRPEDQPSPGPEGRVPENWRDLIGPHP